MKPWMVGSLFVIICIYSALDVYQTKQLLDFGAYEANPLMRWFLDIAGTWKVFIVIKGVVLMILGAVLWLIMRETKNSEKL